MKLKKWIQIILISSSIIALAACSTGRKPQNGTMIDEANAAGYDDAAQSSGLGNDARFGDGVGGTQHAANKGTYYFDFDSNVVHDQDKPAIVANAEKLAARPDAKVMLEGHTDPRGSREYNIGLGERRAKAVAQIMTARVLTRIRFALSSYGAEKLASTGHSESDYQLDRRAVVVKRQQ